MSPDIGQVRSFWDEHPLWTGESRHEQGSEAFFQEHRRVIIEDNGAGRLDERFFPAKAPGGTAVIAVYYRNIIIRWWPLFRLPCLVLRAFGARLRGRGREGIFSASDAAELIRLYDGSENPLGIGYSRREFVGMLEACFDVEEVFFHVFPARSLPVRVPGWLHRALDRRLPFMIFARVRKPSPGALGPGGAGA